MKILMLGWELPPHNSGGLGVACMGLAKAMSQKGADVTFVLPKKVDLNCDFMDIVFADIKGVEKLKSAYTSVNKQLKFSHLGDLPSEYVLAVIEYGRRMREIAAKCQADIIHAHDWLTYPAGIAAKEVLGKPLVVHIHNTVFDRGCGGHNPFEYEIEKEGFEKADRIVAVSEFTKNTVANNYGISEDKIDVVHNGVEETVKKILPETLKPLKELGYKIVLYLGRITMHKGPDYFVKAAKKVLEYDPKVLFIMVGSGDMQEQVMNQAAGLGILEKILFTGFLRGEEKDRLWQAADLFVMPSVSEPFGLVALESVANRTPVLVSRQSGVSEVLNHALKANFWDTDEMANKILAVLSHKSLKHDLRKESLKELANINWDKAADKCLSVYGSIIGT